ncbi:hypothetical protein PPERSA_12242 [Pseudocohnilembus persalinus]|uniref:Pectinacetylesterase family protein n=1 Tax=Pseudocohnilembus persalinus TaxID=266149 RepID=A0A0V0R4U2_PSEPJ|nr:hypothetical protein PPERSA_12242 [Pseudocohnilembus persalinus]|eukprot:KRX09499.1 hypothetical protein PPERSA_12242 [Pseudocohnilembus persalinus]
MLEQEEQGGAWCFGETHNDVLTNCYNRGQYLNTGSSERLRQQVNFEGIFSSDYTENPEFYDYTVIHVNYCDGAGHQGYVKDAIQVPNLDQQIWFRGENNTKTILKYAKEVLNMDKADKVVVSGSSAGGLAGYTWIDFIANDLKKRNPKINVVGIFGGGVFLDYPSFQNGKYSFTNQMRNLFDITNKNAKYINQRCQKQNIQQPWKCMFAQYLLEHIETDILIINSGYDSYQIPFVLEIECVGRILKINHLNGCTYQEQDYIEEFHQEFNQLLKQIQKKKINISSWVISCVGHDYLQKEIFFDKQCTVPQNSGNTAAYISEQFIKKKMKINLIEEISWPDNINCSYKSRSDYFLVLYFLI